MQGVTKNRAVPEGILPAAFGEKINGSELPDQEVQ